MKVCENGENALFSFSRNFQGDIGLVIEIMKWDG